METMAFTMIYVVLGLIVGFTMTWMVVRFKYRGNAISEEVLSNRYVAKELFEERNRQIEEMQTALKESEEIRIHLERKLAAKERDLLYIEEKLNLWQKEYEILQKNARLEFENVANRLLEEKTQMFSTRHEQQLRDLLQPLKEKIREFSQDLDRKLAEEAKDKVSLKKEIEHLRELNGQLSQDAQRLAAALKGDAKIQGNWGELQLERLLENAGLQRGTHYMVQPSFQDENGAEKRPDFVILLPDDKHLIVDAKVSLTAFERFYHAAAPELKEKYLREHLQSVRNHIQDLSRKNYQLLPNLNPPGYLLMFIPLEPAFTLAMQHDVRIFNEAIEKNIVIVTTTTLLATLRTVAHIWKQEQQNRNVLEIARQSGLLYDKFVAFVEDLREVGARLEQAQSSWQTAMNKLSDSRKFGDTLVGRAQRIRELGARASKSLPPELIQEGEN